MKSLDPNIWPPRISGMGDVHLVPQPVGERMSVSTLAIIGKGIDGEDDTAVYATAAHAAYIERCIDIAPRAIPVITSLLALMAEMRRAGARLPDGGGDVVLDAVALFNDATAPIKPKGANE